MVDINAGIITARTSEIGLEPAPFPVQWVMEGRPQAYAKEIARSRDGTMTVTIWSCTTGRFRWQYTVDETVHIVSGEVFILDHGNSERRLGPGDTAFFPAGSSSIWRVTRDVLKVAVCRCPMPRAAGLAIRIWNRISRATRIFWPPFGQRISRGLARPLPLADYL